MDTISIPVSEYQSMQDELKLLRDQTLLKKVNDILELMYERKYGLYLGDFTDDLTEASIASVKEWYSSGDDWNEV